MKNYAGGSMSSNGVSHSGNRSSFSDLVHGNAGNVQQQEAKVRATTPPVAGWTDQDAYVGTDKDKAKTDEKVAAHAGHLNPMDQLIAGFLFMMFELLCPG